MGCRFLVTVCVLALLAAPGCDNSEMDAGAWEHALTGQEANKMECKPVCWGFECGGDGCGGWCGFCYDGETCEAHLCVSSSSDKDVSSDNGADSSTDGGTVALVDFTATLIGFGTDLPTVEAKVELLDNVTGKEIGMWMTSNDLGTVIFTDLPENKPVGFLATKTNHKDTYQFHLNPDSKDETLWIVPNSIYTLALGLAGLQVEPGKGTLAGAVYFVDKAGEEIPLGCLDVSSDPSTEDVRYMEGESGLPTSLDKQGQTHPAHGRFLMTNLAEGKVDIMARAGNALVGSTQIHVVGDSIAIGNIYANKASTFQGTMGIKTEMTFEQIKNAGACVE